jgi:hypothetical protein
MPTDTSAQDFDANPKLDDTRQGGLPAGAGLAIAVTAGAAIWAGVLVLFLL